MGVDLSIVDLVHVEPILVGLNTVDINVVDTILCRTYSVGPFMRSRLGTDRPTDRPLISFAE